MWHFIQEASLDGVWYWDLERPEHEWMSPDFWRLFGHDPDTKTHDPKEWQEIIHPDDRETAMENLRRHCDDPDYPYDQILRYRHTNGSTIWVRCRGIAVRNAAGKAVRMLGTHSDLTTLKQAEVDAQFHRMFLQAPIALFLVGAKGRIRAANDRAATLTGYAIDSLCTMSVEHLVPREFRLDHISLREGYKGEERVARIMGANRDVRLMRQDETTLPVEISLVPFENEREPLVLAALVDITERLHH
ncbi:MAG: PAS domain-containing protein [Magnetospiraceae bacterium]